MISLRQLLAAHPSVLLLDAASSRIQVGWIERDAAARWEISEDEAGIGVFRCIEALKVTPSHAKAFVFCHGPGSILGVRTVAMALRTWCVLAPRPMFAYTSLAIIAHTLGNREVGVIADARRDSWHYYRIGAPLRRVATGDLAGPLVTPENFRHWSSQPDNLQTVPYSLPDLLPRVFDEELFAATDAPDAFLHEEPNYVTWTPQIHRAPAPS